MTTNEILQLDCRIEENNMIIQKVLRLIKPLAKFEKELNIPMEAVEKAIRVMCLKYDIRVRAITTDVYANDNSIIWRADLVMDSTAHMIGPIYGLSTYELLCKICIKMHSLVRANKIKQRRM